MQERLSRDRIDSRVVFLLPYSENAQGSPGLLPFLGALESRGIMVEIVVTTEELLHSIQSTSGAVIALSAQEQTIHRVVDITREVRRVSPMSWIVVGGPLVEHYIAELLNAGVNIVITGEADMSFPLVLDALPEERLPWPDLPCSFIEDFAEAVQGEIRPYTSGTLTDRIFLSGQREEIYSIGKKDGSFLPTERELRDLWVYPWKLFRSKGWTRINLHTQRGCPWSRCSFCTSPRVPARRVAPDQLLDVIAQAQGESVETVAFSDDAFLQDPEWTTAVLEGLQAMNLRGRMDLFGQMRVDEYVQPLLPLLAGAGFIKLELGVETLIPARADLLGKSSDGEAYCRLARHLVGKVASAGIVPQVNVILTDPLSTPDSVAEEIKRLCDLVDKTHRKSGLAPTFNINLITRPSRGSRLSRWYPFSVSSAAGVSTPNEFILSDAMARILTEMAGRTSSETRFAASFEVMEILLDCLERSVSIRESTPSFRGAISNARTSCERIRRRFESQFKILLKHETEVNQHCTLPPELLSLEDWLRGYHEGIDRFSDIAQEHLGSNPPNQKAKAKRS